MSRYAVAWHSPSKTLAMLPGDADLSNEKDASVIGSVVYGEIGDISDATNHPQVSQHLANLAVTSGVNDFSLVTVVNETGNERLDKFVQSGDTEKAAQADRDEKLKVISNRDGLDYASDAKGETQNTLADNVERSRKLEVEHEADAAKVEAKQAADDDKAKKAAEKMAADQAADVASKKAADNAADNADETKIK